MAKPKRAADTSGQLRRSPIKRAAISSNSNGSSASKPSTGRKGRHPRRPDNRSNTSPQPTFIVDPSIFIKSHILLTGAIYRGVPVPSHYRGHHFRYSVSGYNQRKKTYTVEYEKQTIMEDGVNFMDDENSNRDTLDIELSTVQEGMDRYQNALSRISAHAKGAKEAVVMSLKPSDAECIHPSDVDLSDIDEAAANAGKKGYSSEAVIEVCFSVLFAFLVLTWVDVISNGISV